MKETQVLKYIKAVEINTGTAVRRICVEEFICTPVRNSFSE
jgi:hypothetical protein